MQFRRAQRIAEPGAHCADHMLGGEVAIGRDAPPAGEDRQYAEDRERIGCEHRAGSRGSDDQPTKRGADREARRAMLLAYLSWLAFAPPAMALGVRDWKQSQKPRAWWTKAEPSSSPAAIAVNVAAGVVPTTGTPQKADDISVLPAVGGGVAIVAGAILLGVAWKRRKARRR